METQKILIIEDNKLNLKLIRTILLISNFKVFEAENAEVGFQIIEEHRPDIILMDIQLPGMDGLTATRRIKTSEAYKDIPVIALTAKAMDGDEQKALAAGCDGYIVKPINTQGFISTLNNCLQDASKNKPNQTEKILSKENPDNVDALDHRIKNIEDAFSQRRKILIVDDEHLNVQLMERQLADYSYDTIAAYCGEDALDIVEKELPDLIILDIVMPGIDGYEVIRAIRANKRTADIPIILCTVLNSQEERIRGLNIGADEFLNKPIMFEELVARVRSLIRLKAYQDQIRGYETIRESFVSSQHKPQTPEIDSNAEKNSFDKMKNRFENALHTALTDPLTTLYTQKYFLHFLDKELQRVIRNKIPLSLMMIHIDDFKNIKKEYGQSVGNIILKDIGLLLTKSIRDVDIASRYHDEVFAIILPYTDETGASIVSGRLCTKLATHNYTFPESDRNYNITVSIGVVTCQNNPLDKTALIQATEELIQASKNKGKNKVLLKNIDLEPFIDECYDTCGRLHENDT